MPSRSVCRFASSSDAAAEPSASSMLSTTGAPGLLAQVLGRASPRAPAVGRPDPRPQLLAAHSSFLEGVHRPSNRARPSCRTRCPAHVPAPLCQCAAHQRPLALLASCWHTPTSHNPSRGVQMGRFSTLVKIKRRTSSRWCVQVRVRPNWSHARAPALSRGFRRSHLLQPSTRRSLVSNSKHRIERPRRPSWARRRRVVAARSATV